MSKKNKRFRMIPSNHGCVFVDDINGATLDFNKRERAWQLCCYGDSAADALMELAALADYAENEGALYKSLV